MSRKRQPNYRKSLESFVACRIFLPFFPPHCIRWSFCYDYFCDNIMSSYVIIEVYDRHNHLKQQHLYLRTDNLLFHLSSVIDPYIYLTISITFSPLLFSLFSILFSLFSFLSFSGMTSNIPEVQELAGQLAKKVSASSAEMTPQQIGRVSTYIIIRIALHLHLHFTVF